VSSALQTTCLPLPLFCSNPSQSLRTTPFMRFLSSGEDKEEFVRRMRAGVGNDVCLADMFHTRMRDADGNSIRIEMFNVALVGVDLRPHRILGIREFSDEPLNRLPDINPRFQRSSSATPRRRKQHTTTVGRGTAGTLQREELPQPSEPPQSTPVASIFGRSESGAVPTLEHPSECQELPLRTLLPHRQLVQIPRSLMKAKFRLHRVSRSLKVRSLITKQLHLRQCKPRYLFLL